MIPHAAVLRKFVAGIRKRNVDERLGSAENIGIYYSRIVKIAFQCF
jgi:hypothetical protein